MPSIDERIVSMAFENTVFESRVSTTMATLSKLDAAVRNIGSTSGLDKIEAQANKVTLQQPMSALDKLRAKLGGASAGAAEGLGGIDKAGNKVTLEGPSRAVDKLQGKMGQLSAGSTFTDIERASDRVTLSGLTKSLETVTQKFSVLEGAASVALGGIAANAAMKGAAFTKSFAFGPLQQGFSEYQTNLSSIQTILANTQGQQVTGLGNVNKYLGQLNTYSDKTIYNFGEMAKNIGTFTAAGVDLPKSVESIKGIANLAALSGSNSQQASTAMYQLSQAIASGKVGLQDWNSVVNAGMGGAVFQKALLRTADNMGAIEKGAFKIDKATGKATVNGQSFRESIMARPGEQSWLTSDVLTKTLGQFTGDLSAADLAAQGFSESQIKAIQAQAKTAQAAATEVKTLPQVFDIARETIGSGWAKTFSLIFGDFEESKKTFTEFSNFINGFINQVSTARNKVLGDWKKLGGRTVLIQGIKNAFEALMGILTPLRDAFRDIFPAQTGRNLFELTVRFTELMDKLKPSPTTVDALRRVFAGLFAVVHIGWSVIKEFAGVIFDLFGVIGKNSGGFLGFVAGIGDFLVSVDEALTKGGLLKSFFTGLGAVLSVPLTVLRAIGRAIVNLFGGTDESKAQGIADSFENVKDKLGPLKDVIDTVVTAWGKMVDILGRVKTALDPWFSEMADKLSGIGDVIADAFKGLNFDRIMEGLKVGLIGGIFVTLKKALTGGVGGGILGTIKDTLGGVNTLLGGFTKQMAAMQSKLHAEALLAIAAAIALLAGGIYILSTIDGDKLSKALTAVAVGLGELMGSMKLLTSGMGKLAILQLPAIAAGMIGLALATVILAGAMKIFATMRWEDIAKGLVGVAGSIGGIALAMNLMPGGGAALVVQAAGLTALSVGLNLIATAVTIFSKLSWGDLIKGLAGAVLSITGIGIAVALIPPTLPLTAAGLIILGVGLNAIAIAVRSFGSMDLGTLAKGMIAMTAAIAGIGIAVSLIPPTIALSAAGLLIVGSAMVVIAGAIALLGNLNIGTLVKGITALAATLVVLAGGLTLMIVSLPGAAALLVASAALATLVPVLGLLGTMKWSTIFKGLATIAAVMLTVGIAGILAAPGLVAIGVALIPLGLGLMVVAGAAKIFASAVSVLSDKGQQGFAVLLAALTGFIALIPHMVLSIVKGLLSIVEQVAVIAPKVATALSSILATTIDFIIQQAPKLATAIGALVTSIAKVLSDNAPIIIATGAKLLRDLLSGISSNIGSVTAQAADIVTKFFTALAAKTPKLIEAGVKLLTAFIQGITSKIGQVVSTVAGMVVKFINALSRNISKIIVAGQNLMLRFIGAIGAFGPRLLKKGTDMIISFLNGIQQAIPRIKTKALSVARTLVTNLADGLVKLADIGFRGIIRFLNGVARAIRDNDDAMIAAGANVADAIRDGLIKGLHRAGPAIIQAAKDIALAIPNKFLKILGIHSPSKVFTDIGVNTMMGLAQGLTKNQRPVMSAAESMGQGVIGAIKALFGIRSPSKVMMDIGKEVGHGFRDGLDGSATDIHSSFQSLRDKIKSEMTSIREDASTQKDQLREQITKRADLRTQLATETSKKKPDMSQVNALRKEIADTTKEIDASRIALNQNVADLTRLASVRKFVRFGLADERVRLVGLSKDYEKVSKQLAEAEATLDKATQKRDEAITTYTDKYSNLPDINKDSSQQLADYKTNLAKQIEAVRHYYDILQSLRRLGLDDTTYKMLLEQGTQGTKFAEQLLTGGKGAIDEVGRLDADLAKVSKQMGVDAANNLYDAAIKAAKGFVKGFKEDKAELEKTMTQLGNWIVKAIKKRLGIKSPSQEFADIAKLMGAGLVEGLGNSTRNVVNAATQLGDDTVSAMKNSMARISASIAENLDTNPVITPVLDLSMIEKDAQGLSELTNVTPISAAASFKSAAAIANQQRTAQAATDQTAIAGERAFKYIQNNYSPDPLSNIEIYRQTNNQLTRFKSMVGV